MKTSDFDYALPPELIAQSPVEPRDSSRLMVIDRRTGMIEHRVFREITDYLRPGDMLVFNESRVIPARLVGRKKATGGRVELLLLRRLATNRWEALIRGKITPGTGIEISGENGERMFAEVSGAPDKDIRIVNIFDDSLISRLGKVPLPPYIHRPLDNPERYQTVYARVPGSVAAPTAGLHFTPELLDRLEGKGVRCRFITLHVGLDTFRPVREDNPADHTMHTEYAVLGPELAAELTAARAEGRRIIGVGTTTVRTLEQATQANADGRILPFSGWASLYILPGYRFQFTDAMVTNFHLPRTTLLMLVSALTGEELLKRAYREAIDRSYRFYSFGDAMLVL